MNIKKWIQNSFISILLAVCILLILSAFWSSYRYMYNNDEMLHAQMGYLVSIGARPFISYFSIYTPIFHWMIAPIIYVVGTGISTMHVLRIAMVGLFIIEVFATCAFLRIVFGGIARWVFVLLLFLDPFTTFVGMSVRPDTLMQMLFAVGILFGVKEWWFLCGLVLSMSLLTAVKIAPGLFPFVFVFGYLAYTNTQIKRYVFGLLLPWIAFFLYCIFSGSFIPALTQLTIDIYYLSKSITYPTYFGFFYLPDNAYVFGVGGKPITWMYVRILPLFGVFGGVMLAYRALRSKTIYDQFGGVKVALVVGMILQFAALYVPTTAFIQYYIPSYWFFAVCGAVFLSMVLRKPIHMYIGGVLFLVIAQTAIMANMKRAAQSFDYHDYLFVTRWKQIPEKSIVFPGYLFRPVVHPLIRGYSMIDMPREVRKQFVQPEVSLATYDVRYVLLSEESLGYYDGSTQEYIRMHYQKAPNDAELWILK